MYEAARVGSEVPRPSHAPAIDLDELTALSTAIRRGSAGDRPSCERSTDDA